ncbi:MAG: FecR domain-containing protein [Myxococcales bacterium]|nr:FecR domain-containing protein [Myxococcales bacterium]
MNALTVVTSVLVAAIPETWVVQPNDTCDGIARKVWGDPKRISELHQWNELGPLPHHLVPGQVLRLTAPPPVPPSPDATLTFLKPAVRTRRQVEWAPATVGQGLFRLDEVNTLRKAGAALRFRDESTLVMDENALLVILGEAPVGKAPSGLSLVDGELRLSLAAIRKKALAVKTPAASVAAEGGSAGVVAVDGAQTSRVSLFDGAAVVEASGARVAVAQNSGTRVRFGLPPEAVLPLPEQPVLGASMPRVVIWRGVGTSLLLQWAPSARAVKYRVQVARDDQFLDRLDDQSIEATEALVAILERERLKVRVIAYDERGLQSRPSTTATVDFVVVGAGPDDAGLVRHLAPGPLPVALPETWSLQLRGKPLTLPLVLPVGLHELQVVDEGKTVVGALPVLVRPRPPVLKLEPTRLVATFDDELPTDDPPRVNGVAFVRRDGRTWVAPLPTPGLLEIAWHGQPLVRAERGAPPAPK